MWFKTRVGLAVIDGTFEILVAKRARLNLWGIHATRPVGPRFTLKSLLGDRGQMLANYWITLAYFSDGPDTTKQIAQCMGHIEAAILDKSEFCDLSQLGDPEAWRKKSANWNPIDWQR